jgi:zinc/manganese transport system substrate-binding protein
MDRRFLLSLPILALGAAFPAPAAEPLRVVTSISLLGDMVQEIGGARVAVTTLVGADGDVHAFEPTPAASRTLAEADLVIVNGMGLEGWLERLVSASGYKGPLVTASEGLVPRRMGEGGAVDPHAWQDLENGRRYAAIIGQALAAADPAHAVAHAEATRHYQARIAAMDAWVRAEIGKVPPGRRKLITSHDAFGYFGDAYGVRFLAAEGMAAEASAADLRRLILQIRRERITTIFLERAAGGQLARQIARETGARLGGTLYADALAPAGGPTSYLELFAHNVPLMRDAMLAPAGEG